MICTHLHLNRKPEGQYICPDCLETITINHSKKSPIGVKKGFGFFKSIFLLYLFMHLFLMAPFVVIGYLFQTMRIGFGVGCKFVDNFFSMINAEVDKK